jgi:hypothetical protein
VVEIKRPGIFILLIILLCKTASASDIVLASNNIAHEEWGKYQKCLYENRIYFAGYTNSTISKNDILTFNIASKSGQLHSVLKDENIMRTFYSNDNLSLQDSYNLQITEIDANTRQVIVTLLRNGNEVEKKIIAEGENFIYSKKVGNVSDLPILAVHIEKILTGTIIFIQGIFQISEDYVYVNPSKTPTPTPTVTPVKLMIETPEKIIELKMINIKVTYGGWPISGASVKYDNNLIGETYNNGTIEFVPEKSGIHTLTASKTNYNNGSMTITVIFPAKKVLTPTPTVTPIPSNSTASWQSVETLNDKQEIDENTSPLIVEIDNNETQNEKQTEKIQTGNYPAFIVALILIIIVSFLKKRV